MTLDLITIYVKYCNELEWSEKKELIINCLNFAGRRRTKFSDAAYAQAEMRLAHLLTEARAFRDRKLSGSFF